MNFRSEELPVRLNFRGRVSDDDSAGEFQYERNSLFASHGYGRKVLPSKWEDAEKWILSPVSVDSHGHGIIGSKNPTFPPYRRRPKSKSGPLGSPARIKSNAMSSPFIWNSAANSPLMTGVCMVGRNSCGSGTIGDGGRKSCSASQSDHCMVQSASTNVLSVFLDTSSLPSSQDGNIDSTKDGSPILPVVSLTKNAATQTSPNNSVLSSPKERPSSSTLSLVTETQIRSPEYGIRDVHVNDHVTITRWPKKHAIKEGFGKDSTNIKKWKKKSHSKTSARGTTVKCTKVNIEEAKIAAWVNMPKAKAEAASRTPEVKPEKKSRRFSGPLERIFRKLKTARRKEQEIFETTANKRPMFSDRMTCCHMRLLRGSCFWSH